MYLYILVTYQVLRESSKCLATNGMISFTVENYETNEDSAGFEVLSWDDCVLRQQGGKGVRGSTVILRFTFLTPQHMY